MRRSIEYLSARSKVGASQKSNWALDVGYWISDVFFIEAVLLPRVPFVAATRNLKDRARLHSLPFASAIHAEARFPLRDQLAHGQFLRFDLSSRRCSTQNLPARENSSSLQLDKFAAVAGEVVPKSSMAHGPRRSSGLWASEFFPDVPSRRQGRSA